MTEQMMGLGRRFRVVIDQKIDGEVDNLQINESRQIDPSKKNLEENAPTLD